MGQSLRDFRQRQAERGHKRVEVAVSAKDAEIVRRVAKVLVSGGREAEQLRRLFDEVSPAKSRASYREWLAALPEE